VSEASEPCDKMKSAKFCAKLLMATSNLLNNFCADSFEDLNVMKGAQSQLAARP